MPLSYMEPGTPKVVFRSRIGRSNLPRRTNTITRLSTTSTTMLVTTSGLLQPQTICLGKSSTPASRPARSLPATFRTPTPMLSIALRCNLTQITICSWRRVLLTSPSACGICVTQRRRFTRLNFTVPRSFLSSGILRVQTFWQVLAMTDESTSGTWEMLERTKHPRRPRMVLLSCEF